MTLRITDDFTLTRSDGHLVVEVVENPRDGANIEAVRAKVHALTTPFPVYR